MTNILRISIFVLGLTAAVIAGCDRETPETDIYIGLDNGIADGSFQDLMNLVAQQAAASGFDGLAAGTQNTRLDDCPTTTFSAPFGTFPNIMTIDFGESCVGYLGLERSGKVIATFTGPYAEAGTLVTITTDNYFVNGNKVEGVKTIYNEGFNDDGNPYFSINVTGGLITLASGDSISWSASRIREWIGGFGTPEIEDDVYALTDGIAVDHAVEGINRSGIPFTGHIVQPLIRELDCRWMVSGVIEITPEGLEVRSIDYGSGACDNIATLSVGEFITEITLPY